MVHVSLRCYRHLLQTRERLVAFYHAPIASPYAVEVLELVELWVHRLDYPPDQRRSLLVRELALNVASEVR